MLNDLEKKVLEAVQADIPICEKPYSILAEKLKISEESFIKILKELNDKGFIRRFGATLRHQKSGFKSNAMVAWQVDEEAVEDTGKTMSSFTEVSHCYRRSPQADWKYNLYTMIHATDESECVEKVNQISASTGVSRFEILFSKKELKKTSMLYFRLGSIEDEDD